MLFGPWNLRTTVCILFVASCLGNEVFPSYENEYIYERSVERRSIDPKDLNERHRYGNENFDRNESTLLIQRYDRSRRTNENGEHRVAVTPRENQKVSEKSRRQNSNIVERETIGDVTRRLNNRVDERHEFVTRLNQIDIDSSDISNDQRHTPRKLKQPTDSRRERSNSCGSLRPSELNDNREQHKRLDEHKFESAIYSENGKEKLYENLRQTGKRDLSRSLNDVREYFRVGDKSFLERKSIRSNENKQVQEGRQSPLRRFNELKHHSDADLRSGIARDHQQIEKEHGIENERQKLGADSRAAGDVRRFNDFPVNSDANRRSQRLVERHFQIEHEIEQRRDENEQELRVARRSQDNRSNRLINREYARYTKNNRNEDHCSLNTFDEREPKEINRYYNKDSEYKNKREREEFFDGARCFNDREKSESDRRLETDVTLEQISRRVQYKSEREGVRETVIRINYPEVQCNGRRRSGNDITLRRFYGIDNVRDGSRLLRNSGNSHRIDERLPKTRYELAQHSDETDFLRERKTLQDHKTNERRFDDHIQHNSLVRHSDFIRHSQRSITRLSLKENENSRFNEREAGKRLEDKSEERHNILRPRDDREEQRDASRQLESRREDHDKTLPGLDTHEDKSLRSDYTDNSKDERVDRRLEPRGGRGSQYDTRRYLKRHNIEAINVFKDRESLRNTEIHSDVIREERYQLKQREVIRHRNENMSERNETLDGSKDQHDISRLGGTSRKSDRNDERFGEHKTNTRHLSETEPGLSEQRLFEQTFIFKERDTDSKFFEKYYAEKPIDFPRRSYMVFGQGAILAYVILKTLNGKTNLIDMIRIQLREALEIICF